MNRRDFLKLAGLSAGGLILPTGASLLASETDPHKVYLPIVTGGRTVPEFQVFTTPSRLLEVVTPTGLNTGSIPGDLFLRQTQTIDLASNTDCLVDTCGTTQFNEDEARKQLTLENLLREVPVPLVPMAMHPINSIHTVEQGYALDVRVIPHAEPGTMLTVEDVVPRTDDSGSTRAGSGTKIGDYYVRVSLEKHFLGGCIKRDVWHAGALVKYWRPTDKLLFDLHIASWWDSWRPCIGAYESVSKWCKNTCTWNIWNGIFVLAYAAAIVYVSAWLANAIAAAIATSALGVLVAVPGVPPPP